MEQTQRNTRIDEESINLLEMCDAVRKHIKPILIFFLAVSFLTAFCTFFIIPKKYKSRVIFYIEEKQTSGGIISSLASQGLGGLLPTNGMLGGSTNTDLCVEIVRAPSFLRNVLKSENLPHSWDDVEKFTDRVRVEKKPKSGALELSVLWKDPVISYRLAKRIFNDYQKFVDEQINHNNSRNRVFIEGQYKISKKRLDTAEAKLLEYEKSKGVPILPETTNIAINYFASLEQQKVSTEISLNDARHRLKEASNILDKRAPEVKDNVSDAVSSIIQNYKNRISDIEIELAKARETYTDEHPTIKALLKQKEEVERQIKAQSDSLHAPSIAGGYMNGLVEVAGLEARLSSINRVYSEIYPQISQMPDAMLNYGQLVREQRVAEQIYIMLSGQLEQAKISEAKDDNVTIQVIQPAIVPFRKYSPSTVMNTFAAGMLTLLIGVGTAIYTEKFRGLSK